MVRKHFYLINYILDISLFGHERHVFRTELQGCMLILHFTTLPEKRIHYRKGKRCFGKRMHGSPSFPYFDFNSTTYTKFKFNN